MKYVLPVALCALLLPMEAVHADDFSQIERAVSKQFPNPESTQFSQLFRSKAAPQIYCGKVTSKNRSGSYTGERLFMYDSQFDNLTVLENPQIFQYELDTPEKFQEMDRAETGIKSYIALCVLNREPGS